jgi:hypothetical protein
LTKFIGNLAPPAGISIVFFTVSVYFFATAFGYASFHIEKIPLLGKIPFTAQETKRGKFWFCTAGIVFAALGIWFSTFVYPKYQPTAFGQLIYSGTDTKQIISDGEDVYLLKDNGNILRITRKGLQWVDDGTGTKQIAPAGGVIYILKENGNIWAGQWIDGKYDFKLKDPAPGTKQIVSVGETLYVLKNDGNIWKYFTRPIEPERVDLIHDEFVKIDPGTNTDEIASSGALLYVLKGSGTIWKYSPVMKGSEQQESASKGFSPYEEIYKDGGARSIRADGGSLYFIKADGTVWRYKERLDQVFNKSKTRKIESLNGIVYILTSENAIWRYNLPDDDLRELRESGSDNKDIAAYGPDIFVIKNNGNVWRYNEVILTR